VHEHGGQVYVDGANLNALLGWPAGRVRRRRLAPQPAQDLLHPARRRRPGVGPVAARRTWRRTCPRTRCTPSDEHFGDGIGVDLRAPYGSAGILPISWAYVR
jgi:glycine dehydrogenase